MESELYRLGTNYAVTFPDLVRRSSPEMARDATKEWIFPGGVIILVRGPGAALKASLETLGQIQSIAP
jgi:hypothetical protein